MQCNTSSQYEDYLSLLVDSSAIKTFKATVDRSTTWFLCCDKPTDYIQLTDLYEDLCKVADNKGYDKVQVVNTENSRHITFRVKQFSPLSIERSAPKIIDSTLYADKTALVINNTTQKVLLSSLYQEFIPSRVMATQILYSDATVFWLEADKLKFVTQKIECGEVVKGLTTQINYLGTVLNVCLDIFPVEAFGVRLRQEFHRVV